MTNRKAQTASGKPALRNRLRTKAEPKYTLRDALDFFTVPGDAVPDDNDAFENFDFERAIRATGFLLHWCSQMGNDPIEGRIADGLGTVLDQTANRFGYIKAGYERALATLRRAHASGEDRK